MKSLMIISVTQNGLLLYNGPLSVVKGVSRSATRELTGVRRVP
jgi:hypothetical protein